LSIFLEKEARTFQSRFSDAASSITGKLETTESLIANMQRAIEKRVEDIADQLGWSDFNLDDTGDKIDRVEALLHNSIRRQKDAGSRLRELLKAGSVLDPIRERAREAARIAIEEAIFENESMIRGASTGDKIHLETTGEIAEELNSAELQSIFEQILEETLFRRTERMDDNSGNTNSENSGDTIRS
tara:strand:+ start:713 stop:1273 length:561 start_codon:yes stop_codon:yes gene_type:complete